MESSELNWVPDADAQIGRHRLRHVAETDRSPEPTAKRPPLPRIAEDREAAHPPPAARSPDRIASMPASPAQPPTPKPQPEAHPEPAATPPPQNNDDVRAAQRVEAAQALLGTSGLQDRAFVAQVLRASAQDVAVDAKLPYAAALWAKLESAHVAKSAPKAGDLVFFRDTADLNGNGKPDDGVTLVGVVERAQGTHTLFIAHRAGKVRRMAVDPQRPMVIRDAGGEVVNTRLVRWPGTAEPWTTGQCLVGYARPR